MERRSCKKIIDNKSGKKKQLWANSRSGTGIETERYRYRPSEANRYWYRSKRYRYRPIEDNLYQYRSERYWYRSAQNVQNCVFLYN